MIIPTIVAIIIPIFLGIVYVTPFDEPEIDREVYYETNSDILYYILLGIWVIVIIRIIFQVKRGTFRISQRY